MAATIPTTEPVEFRAGDSVLWTRSFDDYSATEYTLAYYLVGPSRKITVNATADGSEFDVEITAAISATLEAGAYWLEGKVTETSTGRVTTIYSAALNVLPNIASDQVSAGFDGRSVYKKALDECRAMLLGIVAFPESGYTIFGERQVTLRTLDEVRNMVGWLESKVAEEQKAADIKAGKRTGIYMRFTSPR